MGKHLNEHYAYSRDVGLSQRISYTAGGLEEYIGLAYPGAADSEAKWQISKLTYNGSNQVTQINWAGGNDNFEHIWDNRASLTYS